MHALRRLRRLRRSGHEHGIGTGRAAWTGLGRGLDALATTALAASAAAAAPAASRPRRLGCSLPVTAGFDIA